MSDLFHHLFGLPCQQPVNSHEFVRATHPAWGRRPAMSSDWTAAEISEYDQAMRGTETGLNRLVATFQRRIAEAGEIQAMADITAYLNTLEPAAVRGTLTAALKRLAATEAGP